MDTSISTAGTIEPVRSTMTTTMASTGISLASSFRYDHRAFGRTKRSPWRCHSC